MYVITITDRLLYPASKLLCIAQKTLSTMQILTLSRVYQECGRGPDVSNCNRVIFGESKDLQPADFVSNSCLKVVPQRSPIEPKGYPTKDGSLFVVYSKSPNAVAYLRKQAQIVLSEVKSHPRNASICPQAQIQFAARDGPAPPALPLFLPSKW